VLLQDLTPTLTEADGRVKSKEPSAAPSLDSSNTNSTSRAQSAPLLLSKLRKALQQAADPSKAPMMQAYMKSDMPYHGVPTPLLRQVCKIIFADLRFATPQDWQSQVLNLWRGARFREERYAALLVAGDKRARAFQTLSAMKMYEELIVTGAWWDFVDDIASHRIGPILRNYPAAMQRKMLAWSKSKDLWKRRTAILCQLGFKAETDLELLYACIEPSLGSQEFFLQKAIGWALRQYAWTDPAEVKKYVRLNRARLSALSCREALKNIG
jgi:3-methyladenine DNA glycosylase AlkD